MKMVTATDAQSNFCELLMQAQAEPVEITRNGKGAGVLLSTKDYRELNMQALRQALLEGEESRDAGELDMEHIRREAKQEVGLNAPPHA
jgi:antitoxin Phd